MLGVIFDWVFSWTGILVLVPSFIAFGWGGMSMSPPACLIARICFTIAAILLLAKIVILAISTESSTLNRIIATFVMFGIIGAIYVEVLQWIKTRELLQLSGILTPDNKSTPAIDHPIPEDAFIILLGNGVAYTKSFPHTVIRVKNKDVLVINKINERMSITAKLFGKDGRIVAELKDNKFNINPNNYYKIDRPNYYTLIVYDQEDNQVLNVEYMNQNAIKFLGRFHVPNGPPLIINDNHMELMGNKFMKYFFGESKGADINIK